MYCIKSNDNFVNSKRPTISTMTIGRIIVHTFVLKLPLLVWVLWLFMFTSAANSCTSFIVSSKVQLLQRTRELNCHVSGRKEIVLSVLRSEEVHQNGHVNDFTESAETVGAVLQPHRTPETHCRGDIHHTQRDYKGVHQTQLAILIT